MGGFLTRALKFMMVLLVLAGVVLWFAALRGDRGYFEEEVTIDRAAPVVYRWITTDELLRRWISDVTKLERIGSAGQTNYAYRLDQLIGTFRVSLKVRIMHAIPNQELEFVRDARDGIRWKFYRDVKLNCCRTASTRDWHSHLKQNSKT